MSGSETTTGQRYYLEIMDWRPTLASELRCHPLKAAQLKTRDFQRIEAANFGLSVPAVALPLRVKQLRRKYGIGPQPSDPVPKKRRVTFVIHCDRGPFPDPDAPLKSGLDALARAGLIVDDSERWCEWDKPVYRRGPRRTDIIIEDI